MGFQWSSSFLRDTQRGALSSFRRQKQEKKMEEDCDFLPKATLITRPPRRSALTLRMFLAAIMMCSVYMYSISLKQTKIHIKPEILRIKSMKEQHYDHRIAGWKKLEIEIKQELLRTKPIEQQHTYDPKMVGLEQTDIRTKPKMVNVQPMDIPSKVIGKHSYDRRIVGLTNPELATVKPTNPELATVKPIELHSGLDARFVSLKQVKLQMKQPLDEHSFDAMVAGLKQTKPQIKLESKQIQPPCPNPEVPESEMPYLHYPVPTNYTRRECACTPVRFFVIVTMQRSGSKWLETLLNSHRNISSNGEIFINRERSANVSAIRKTLDKVYNLDWTNSVNKKRCVAAVGFKWMLNQGIMGYDEEVFKYFTRRGVSVIFLFRRNLLRRMVSVLANSQDHRRRNATHKAHVNTQDEADRLASFRPILNPKSLVRKLKRADSRTAEAVEHFKSLRHMVLYYEDLVKNSTKLTDVMEFLRVPQRNLHSHHVKIHKKPLSDIVRNWSSVRKVLKGTQFESFLTSDYSM